MLQRPTVPTRTGKLFPYTTLFRSPKGIFLSFPTVVLRRPTDGDGYNLHQLVARCQPLDTNSCYGNLLQCSDFADTAIAAENAQGELVGFISGYRPPAQIGRAHV